MAELYDPNANTWTPTGKMNEPRNFATAHLLGSGKVLVVGGAMTGNFPGVAIVDASERYIP